jgi:hypothetical protein
MRRYGLDIAALVRAPRLVDGSRGRALVMEICRLLISYLPFFYADVLLLRAFEYMIASAVDGNEELARFDVGGCLCCKV